MRGLNLLPDRKRDRPFSAVVPLFVHSRLQDLATDLGSVAGADLEDFVDSANAELHSQNTVSENFADKEAAVMQDSAGAGFACCTAAAVPLRFLGKKLGY